MYTPVSKREQTSETTPVGGYVPVASRPVAPTIKPFDIATSPKESTNFSFNSRSPFSPTQESTPQTDFGALNIPGKALEFGKDVAQAVPRTAYSALIDVHNIMKPDERIDKVSFKDQYNSYFVQDLLKRLTGTEEVPALSAKYEENAGKFKEWQDSLPSEDTPGLSVKERTVLKIFKNLDPKVTAFAGTIGSAALDLTPFGGTEKGLLKTIAKTKTVEEALILARRMGVADDLLQTFSEGVVKATNEKEARQFFDNFLEMSLKTKPTPSSYIPLAERLKGFADNTENVMKDVNVTPLAEVADEVQPSFKKGNINPSKLERQAKAQDVPFNTVVEEGEKKFRQLFDKNEIDFLFPEGVIKDNEDAWGIFDPRKSYQNPLVQVVQNGGKISDSNLYHESFHAFMYKFMSPEDRQFLLDAVKNDPTLIPQKIKYRTFGYKGAEATSEEYLADAFARWMAKREGSAQVQSAFQRIYEKIQTWIRKMIKAKVDVEKESEKVFKRIVDKDRSYVRPEERKLNVKIFEKKKSGAEEAVEKVLKPIDNFIAEGKIRIKRIGNRDVYEYKKGDRWQRARDEDSAVKAVTPVQKPINHELEAKKLELQIKQDVLENHPARDLGKYVSRSGEFKGELKEVTGEGGTFGKRGDDMATERGFTDSEEARASYEEYKTMKQEVADLKKEVRDITKSSSEEKARPQVRQSKEEVQSLENTAEQMLNKVDEPYREKALPLQKIITDTNTPVKEKVGIIDYFRTPDRVLKKIGLEDVAKTLRESYDNYLQELPVHLDIVTDWSKQVPKESNQKIFKYLDGQKGVVLNDAEQKVADEIKQYLEEWAFRLGLPEDKRISHYITHIFDIGVNEKEFDEEIANMIKDKVAGSVYDPFLEQRLGKKGYIEDTWKALDAYIKRAVRKSNMDPALDQMKRAAEHLEDSQFNYVKRLGDRVNMRPTEWDNLLDNAIKQMVGYKFGQRPTAYITGTLRKLVYRGALGININSAIKNLTQGVNTFAKLGATDTLKGYISLFKPANLKELESAGVLRNGFIQDRTLSATKQALQKADKGLFMLFELAEKINRGSAYFGAKSKAIAKGMTEEQAIKYAKKLVRDTQFNFGSIDTPVAMQGDIMKTIFQFGNFSQKQIEFLTEMLSKKEWAGVARYIVGALATVYTIGQVFDIDLQDFNPLNYFSRFGKPPSLALPIEVAKAVTNVPDQYGNTPTTERKIKNIANAGKTLIPGSVQLSKFLKGNIISNKKDEKKSSSGLPELPKLPLPKSPVLPKLPALPKI